MSPYHYPDRIPKVAKNWSPSRQRRCTAAAQAVLESGGSEADAVFACIHAAKHKQTDEDQYDTLAEHALVDFQDLVALYFAGQITLSQFGESFQARLKNLYRDMLLANLDHEPTDDELDYLNMKLDEQFKYLDGFMDDLGNGRMTQQRALWRAGLYAFPRSVFVAGSIPHEIVELMRVLPGDDCLGGPAGCGCQLQVEYDVEGNASVYWVVDPLKEHCPICLGHAAESPYTFTAEEIVGVL